MRIPDFCIAEPTSDRAGVELPVLFDFVHFVE